MCPSGAHGDSRRRPIWAAPTGWPQAHTKASRRRDTEGAVYGTATFASIEKPLMLTVLYDADCGVCRHTARTLQMLDSRRQLSFQPLQRFAAASADDPPRSELEARLHVRDDRGRWHAGGAAALAIAAAVPVLMPLALIGRLPGMGRIADLAYGFVARNRHAISRWLGVDSCRFTPNDLSPGDAARAQRRTQREGRP